MQQKKSSTTTENQRKFSNFHNSSPSNNNNDPKIFNNPRIDSNTSNSLFPNSSGVYSSDSYKTQNLYENCSNENKKILNEKNNVNHSL